MDDEQTSRLYPIHCGRKPERPSPLSNCACIIIGGRPVVGVTYLSLLGIATRAQDIITEERSRWNSDNYDIETTFPGRSVF